MLTAKQRLSKNCCQDTRTSSQMQSSLCSKHPHTGLTGGSVPDCSHQIFFFKHLLHMSLAFCRGVKGSCSSAVFFLGCFLGGSSWPGVEGADAGVVGLGVVELLSGAGLLGAVFGGPILTSRFKTTYIK